MDRKKQPKGYSSSYRPVKGVNSWAPGLLTCLPWTALLAIFGVIILAFGSAAILKHSHDKPTKDWPMQKYPIQPTVLLSASAALSGALLRYALAEGQHIIWWRHALAGGTVGDLHRYWAYGHGFLDAICAGRYTNLMSMARVITTFVVIQGPLLQRASSIELRQSHRPVNITAILATNPLPTGFTGIRTGRAANVAMLTPEFLPAVQEYNHRSPIRFKNSCPDQGYCNVNFTAPGFDTNCITTEEAYNETYTVEGVGKSFKVLSTSIYTGGRGDSAEWMKVETSYKPKPDLCIGYFVVTKCNLQEAIVRYPVRIENGTILLDPISYKTNYTVKLRPQYTFPSLDRSTLGGIALVASSKYGSSVELYRSGAIPYTLMTTGSVGYEYINNSNSLMVDCSLTWDDPTLDILNGIRELMFRAAIAASNSTTTQTVSGTQSFAHTVYQSHYQFLLAALIVPLLSVGFVTSLFIGWWELGRKVSYSPIELAKAFGAPLLEGRGSNATGIHWRRLSEKGEKSAVYGDSDDDGEGHERRLGMADPMEVEVPKRGVYYF
ncbi:hypothetical protein BDD12DRAFT_908713 [Trichophaea hybrida]|nr:hypothetical protein BDD12DRAFT_908713 [Trichophaea hybrida]